MKAKQQKILERYSEFKATKKQCDKELKSLKKDVLQILDGEPEQWAETLLAELQAYDIKAREKFDLKAARKKLNEEILAPFLKKGKTSRGIRVTFKGAKEEAA